MADATLAAPNEVVKTQAQKRTAPIVPERSVAGRTLVLAGFERLQTQLDDADVVRGVLPLARRGLRARQGTVVLITPRLVEP